MKRQTTEVFSPDADLESADWTKQSWDLPPYMSKEFLEIFPDIEAFKKLPVYKFAVVSGLILDDEWVGDWVELSAESLPVVAAESTHQTEQKAAMKTVKTVSHIKGDPKSSGIPPYVGLMQPLIEALRLLGGSGTVEEIYDKTVEIIGLSDELISQLHDPDKGSATEVGYRLAWARTYLKKFGILENSSRGVWALTEKGKGTEELDTAGVVKFFRRQAKQPTHSKGTTDETVAELAEEDDWKSKLSATLTQMEPAAFERLVQRVLRESGFVQVEVTGRTGDGGIDGRGIARIHGFLSFHVLFQCKRYKGAVGAPDIRDFRGALAGRADKGLFITTGSFTPAANKEATRDGAPPIDLVNGDELAEKLRELEIGVTTEKTTVEKVSVDTAWFKGI